MTQGGRDTGSHAGAPTDPAHQTRFPSYRLLFWQIVARLEAVCLAFSQAPENVSQDQQMEIHEPDDSAFRGMQNLLSAQHCFLAQPSVWIQTPVFTVEPQAVSRVQLNISIKYLAKMY